MESEKPPEGKSGDSYSHLTLTLASHITLTKAVFMILGLSFFTRKVEKGMQGLGPHQRFSNCSLGPFTGTTHNSAKV